MINTPFGHATRADGYELRLEAVKHGVTHVTNLAGAQAMVAGREAARLGRPRGRGLAGPAPVGAFALTRRVLRASCARKTRNRTWNRVFRAKRRWLPISDAPPVCYTEGVSSFRMIP